MKDRFIDFHCTYCKHTWKGLFVPLSCPKCEGVLGIVIDLEGDDDEVQK